MLKRKSSLHTCNSNSSELIKNFKETKSATNIARGTQNPWIPLGKNIHFTESKAKPKTIKTSKNKQQI